MKRPKLNKIQTPELPLGPGVFVTVSPGQWDEYFDAAYNAGFTLLEIDEIDGKEVIVSAYRRETEGNEP